jgi:hypothetical protein
MEKERFQEITTIKKLINTIRNRLSKNKRSATLDFDQQACSYFLLAMNFQQSIFELQVMDSELTMGSLLPDSEVDPIEWLDNLPLVRKENNIDYWIAITSEFLPLNSFFRTKKIKSTKSGKRLWVITSADWKRFYSPPSVFEYLATTVVRIVLESISLEFQNEELRKINSLKSHGMTLSLGCIFDYTRFKSDRRILICNPNLCNDCRYKLELLEKLVNEKLGKGNEVTLIQHLDKVISRNWMGDLDQKDSPFYNLKKIYKYDINRNSGFNKGLREKFRDSIIDNGPEWTIGTIITGVITGILGVILYLIFGIKN